jgi:hypothetical protein
MFDEADLRTLRRKKVAHKQKSILAILKLVGGAVANGAEFLLA